MILKISCRQSLNTHTKLISHWYDLYKLETFNLRVKSVCVAAALELGGDKQEEQSDGINTHRHVEFCSYLRAVRLSEESSELTF